MSRRLPPNDGLATFIFPKLAAMLAIKQSDDLAKEHSLAPTHRDEIQAAAMQRAAEQEASSLRWNARYKRYELEHPAIGRNMRDPNFAFSPTSSRPNGGVLSLHITVSTHSIVSSTNRQAAPPVIMVTVPTTVASPLQLATADIRTSTIPESDTDGPLASLDFGTRTLHINADRIMNLMPSLFAIDSIVSAIMAVAVSDEAINPIMANMDIWTPCPKAPASMFGGSQRSYAGSVFYATLAEREEAEQEAKSMRPTHHKDVHVKSVGEKQSRRWFGRKEEKEKKEKKAKTKKKQIVMGEFDLEKLGHYQAGDRKGEELPGVTRGVLSGLIMGLRLVVWLLTTIVQVIVWILVHMSRAVTSEKF